MKKLLCITLALIMVLSLCACGQEKPNNGNDQTNNDQTTGGNDTVATTAPTEATTVPAAPTEEEEKLLKEYVRTVAELNQATHYTHYQHLYAKLQEMEGVDKWVGTEHTKWAYNSVWNNDRDLAQDFNEETDWDRQAILARFAVVEDVYLGHSVIAEDNLGNVKGNEKMTHTRQYYADGTVRAVELHANPYLSSDWDDFDYKDIYGSRFDVFRVFTLADGDWEYDDAGRVIKITDEKNGKVDALYEISYNTDGTISNITKKENTKQKECTFSYQEDGRLVTVSSFDSSGSVSEEIVIEYTYNADGTLAKEEIKQYLHKNGKVSEDNLTHVSTMEYVYDSNGKLVSGTYTDQVFTRLNGLYKQSETVSQYTFTTDAEGRVTQVVKIPGDTLNWNYKGEQTSTRAAEEAKITYNLYYGNFYIYTPAE